MKIRKLTYIEFLSLPEDERIEQQEIVLVSSIFDVDCSTWKWSVVKDLQERLTNDLTYYDIFDIAKLGSKKLKQTDDFHLILGMFNAIKKSIETLKESENTALSSDVKPEALAAMQEVGGFEMFGSLPQTLALTKLFNMSYTQVNNLQWDLCFSALVYDKRFNDFKAKILK